MDKICIGKTADRRARIVVLVKQKVCGIECVLQVQFRFIVDIIREGWIKWQGENDGKGRQNRGGSRIGGWSF